MVCKIPDLVCCMAFQCWNPRLARVLYVTRIAAARACFPLVNGSANISNMLEVENVN